MRLRMLWRRMSLRKKNALALLALSLIMTLFLSISAIQMTSQIIIDLNQDISEESLAKIRRSFEDYFQNVDKNATQLLRIPSLREVLRENYETGGNGNEKLNLQAAVREIATLAAANDKISFVTINFFGKNGFAYSFSNPSSVPFGDYNGCISYYLQNGYLTEGYKPSAWCDVIDSIDAMGNPIKVFLNIRMTYDPSTYKENGLLLIGVNENDLLRLYSDFSDSAMIIHKNGQIISSAVKAPLAQSDSILRGINSAESVGGTISISGDKTRQSVTFNKIAFNDAYFIIPFDYYSVNDILRTNEFARTIVLLVLIGVLFSLLLSMLFSKALSSSVLSLKQTLSAVQSGDLRARYHSENRDEVAYLGERFNHMLDEINALFEKQEQDQQANKELELKLIQSQINPHLLYNTMETALWSINTNNISLTEELLVGLSEFFKISLSGGSELIPLSRELELVGHYMSLQRIARGKNLSLKTDIPEDMLDSLIFKLSLQPIVENAVMHGFSGFRDDGAVTIKASRQDGCMEIAVEDNGIGIPEEKLAELKEMLHSDLADRKMKHFGLYNVHRRISRMFGPGFGLSIESEVGCYTRVTIRTGVIYNQSN